jgi:hypothetical protein
MRLTSQQIQKIAERVFEKWKQNNIVTFKVDEKRALDRAYQALAQDYQKELDLEKEVNKMLDDLERSNSGQFQRFKMYPLLKQKLAKEKKVIL